TLEDVERQVDRDDRVRDVDALADPEVARDADEDVGLLAGQASRAREVVDHLANRLTRAERQVEEAVASIGVDWKPGGSDPTARRRARRRFIGIFEARVAGLPCGLIPFDDIEPQLDGGRDLDRRSGRFPIALREVTVTG